MLYLDESAAAPVTDPEPFDTYLDQVRRDTRPGGEG